MNAHIISIGDELLIGQTVNTNSAYIAEKLTDIQIHVVKSSVVGDDEESIISEFELAFSSCDLVIVTGGLGPTHDDITREAVVKFFNTELTHSAEVLENIKERFIRLNREMSKVNEGQAMIPKISAPIKNYNGTAPGFWIEQGEKLFIVLPGVPFEMKEMMAEFVLPRLSAKIKPQLKGISKRLTLLTTGIPESTLFEKLEDITQIIGSSKLAFLPNQFGVKLRISVFEEDEEKADNKILGIEQKIRAAAGRFIYGKDDDELYEVVGKMLLSREITIAIAESCTGGYISHLLTNVSGSSNYFIRGIVAYSNSAKVELLKVDEEVIVNCGAVSFEVARQMAEGVRAVSGTDIGLSVTGIMGPTGGSTDKPVGTAFIGFCDDKVCTAEKFNFGDNRLRNKQRVAQAALEMLRKYIIGIPFDA